MYFPKSQIKTNLYSNPGELVYKDSNIPFTGYYWTTSTGKYFTGKNPNETPTKELIVNFDPENTVPTTPDLTSPVYKNNFGIYDTLKKNPIDKARGIPVSFSPQPTQEDYSIGEYQRYFAKKINEVIYIETNKDTYNKLVSQDSSLYFEQYIPFDFPWQISGEKEQVARVNKNVVELTMVRKKLPKFGEYLRFDYLKYYK